LVIPSSQLGKYLDWWPPLAGLSSRYSSKPVKPTQPGQPSVDRRYGFGHRWE